MIGRFTALLILFAVLPAGGVVAGTPIPIIIDSDANNELDDQQAIAYAALDPASFELIGVTVNRTSSGGELPNHVEEAIRVLTLCARYPEVPVFAGADGSYEQILPQLASFTHDGRDAVDFIIREARKPRADRLVVAAIGKLTNIALALAKAPDIRDKVEVIWLGSNYPEPGEYNLINDLSAINPVIQSGVKFTMAVVRYDQPSGTDAVRITPVEVGQNLAGRGPRVADGVPGRNGGRFHTFGDYAVDLFAHIDLYGDPPSRALFDMAALAVIKHGSWARPRSITAPRMQGQSWASGVDSDLQITVWEYFEADAIIDDFVRTVSGGHGEQYTLPQ